jgi:hypothetical protein
MKTGTTETSGSQNQKKPEEEPGQDAPVPLFEAAANPHGERDVPVVPVLDAEYGEDGDLEGPLGDDEITQLGLLSLGELLERFDS